MHSITIAKAQSMCFKKSFEGYMRELVKRKGEGEIYLNYNLEKSL